VFSKDKDHKMIRLLATASLLPAAALADVPRVMTDFAPLHSLTAQVMGELGTPDVLMPTNADPHDFALRPSDAERLSTADIVFWIGNGLTPWLEEPLETLAPNAANISLLDTEGWVQLDIRGDDDHGNEDDDHDDHDDKEEDHAAHDNDEDKHDDHAHDHGDFDPHAWLDPSVAQLWLAEIATELSARDPENAEVYTANAEAASAALASLDANIAEQLAVLSDRAYILPHDGYQYFEVRYGLTAQAAISGIDARTPGPAQIAEIRAEMAEQNVVCVFSDAEIGERWAAIITEGTDAKTVQIDGVGIGLEAGPDLYAQLLNRLADQFTTCLGETS